MNQVISGAHQQESLSPLISWVNPFPSRFICRTALRGGFARTQFKDPMKTELDRVYDMFGKHNNKQAPFLQTAKMRSKKNLLEFVLAATSHAPPKWDAHLHPKMRCACAYRNKLRMCISKEGAHAHTELRCPWDAHAHTKMRCARTPRNELRMRISFCSAQAHVILVCACAFSFLAVGACEHASPKIFIRNTINRDLAEFFLPSIQFNSIQIQIQFYL